MRTFDIIMLIIGAAFFAIAGLVLTPPHPKVAWRENAIALGLLAWILVPLVTLIKQ